MTSKANKLLFLTQGLSFSKSSQTIIHKVFGSPVDSQTKQVMNKQTAAKTQPLGRGNDDNYTEQQTECENNNELYYLATYKR